ncbi:DUF692 family protein [Galbibacter sp. EGI 63066]|nr:DUF692 family protein [Galbibacter sp. EGI 63066]
MLNQLECLPELGVGIIYSPSIEEITMPDGLIDTIEIEPQTLCTRDKNDRLNVPQAIFEKINELPYNKLTHSIGAPVGGSLKPSKEQIALINYCSSLFKSPWVTEHLSFNATSSFQTGFFLPPCQTQDGLKTVIENVKLLQDSINAPIAIETGVNYLKPNEKEIEDGLFVSEICKETNCGILLDIHNLFANQLNGRQSIQEFIEQIPKENVIEIHIAGGTELNALWLDSHSGPIDERLLSITKEVLPEFSNLKAITYEIFDSYVPVVGDATIIKELEKVRTLWENRKKRTPKSKRAKLPEQAYKIQEMSRNYDLDEWEGILSNLVIGRKANDSLNFLAKQNADRVAMYQHLINEFRASMVVRIYKLTTRYLILVLGMDSFFTILDNFWSKNPPEQLSYKEAQNFSSYLKDKAYKMPWLYRLLNYENQILESILYNTIQLAKFDVDPTPMLKSLSEGQLPETKAKKGDFEIEITPEKDEATKWFAIPSYLN